MKQEKSLKTKTPLRRNTPLSKSSKKTERKVSRSETSKTKVRKPIENKKRHTDELDKVFQFYVRLRDSMPGGYCRCISCGKIVPFDKIQAGHFRSRRFMSTRWNEYNVNGECFSCNCLDGDHLLDYRKNLIKKIGEKKVEWIEAYCHETQKWSDFELVIMLKEYSKKCVALSREKEIPLSQIVQRITKKYI